MRPRRGVTAAALVAASTLALPAEAQYLSWRASMTASGSYSYSITDDAYPNAQTFRGPSVSFSPSLVLLYDTPRTTNTLLYTFSLSLPFTKDLQLSNGPVSYSNRFSYSGRYNLTERTNLSLSVLMNHSPMRGLSLSGGGDAGETAIDAIPTTAGYLLNGSVQESLSHSVSEAVTITQSSSAALTAPMDPLIVRARTLSFGNSLSVSRMVGKNSFGLSLSVGASYFTVGEVPNGGVTNPHLSLADTLSLTWNRQLTPTLKAAAALGVTQIISFDQPTPTAVQPSGNVSLNYSLDPAAITLTYAHAASPNLVTGSVNFTDSATLRFSLPLSLLSGLSTSGSAGFSRLTPLESLGAATSVILGDVALSYHPDRVPSLGLSTRVQVSRQAAGDASDGFTRITTSLSLSYSYPSANAAQTPPNMPPALGATPYVPGGGGPLPERLFEEPAE